MSHEPHHQGGHAGFASSCSRKRWIPGEEMKRTQAGFHEGAKEINFCDGNHVESVCTSCTAERTEEACDYIHEE